MRQKTKGFLRLQRCCTKVSTFDVSTRLPTSIKMILSVRLLPPKRVRVEYLIMLNNKRGPRLPCKPTHRRWEKPVVVACRHPRTSLRGLDGGVNNNSSPCCVLLSFFLSFSRIFGNVRAARLKLVTSQPFVWQLASRWLYRCRNQRLICKLSIGLGFFFLNPLHFLTGQNKQCLVSTSAKTRGEIIWEIPKRWIRTYRTYQVRSIAQHAIAFIQDSYKYLDRVIVTAEVFFVGFFSHFGDYESNNEQSPHVPIIYYINKRSRFRQMPFLWFDCYITNPLCISIVQTCCLIWERLFFKLSISLFSFKIVFI